MKLIKCYVENFGTLSKYSLDLVGGMNTVLEQNGWGKSTLAAFIKAMLYGLPDNRTKDLNANDRKKYFPWNGGKFGGYIIFEAGKRTYRVERFFGKGKKDDVFRLTDEATGKESNDFPSDLGVKLFGIDGDGYESTAFVPQKYFDNKTENDSVRAKLTNSEGFSADMSRWESADGLLDKAETKYRKKKGKGGEIYETEQKILDVRKRLDEIYCAKEKLNDIDRQLSEAGAKKSDLENQLRAVEADIKKANEKKVLAAKYETYKTIKVDVEKAEKELAEISEFFCDKYPKKEEIESVEAANRDVRRLAEGIYDTESEISRLTGGRDGEDKLCALFGDAEISTDGLENLRDMYTRLAAELKAAQGMRKPVSSERMAELEGHFGVCVPDTDGIAQAKANENKSHIYINKVNEYREPEKFAEYRSRFGNEVPSGETVSRMASLISAANESAARRESVSAKKKSGFIANAVAAVIGIALCAVGAVLLSYIMSAGIAAIAVGAVCAATAVVTALMRIAKVKTDGSPNGEADESLEQVDAFLSRYGKSGRDRLSALMELNSEFGEYRAMLKANSDYRVNVRERDALQGKVRAFAEKYGYGDSASVSDIEKDLGEYQRAEAAIAESEKNLTEAARKCEECKKRIYDVLGEKICSAYDSSDAVSLIGSVIADLAVYRELTRLNGKLAEQRSDMSKKEKTVSDFLGRYYGEIPSDTDSAIQNIRNKLIRYFALFNDLKAKKAELDGFVRENGIKPERAAEFSEADSADISELESKQELLRGELSGCERNMAELNRDRELPSAQVERFPEAEQETAELQDRKKELELMLDTVSTARKYLAEAKESLTAKYLSKVREGFGKYMKLIAGSENINASVDIDFSVSFEESGERKDFDFYSRGYRDLIGICLRFALLDTLYENEKPFAVLDDPFVNLDNEKLDCAKKLLVQLSEHYQIIYLVCHTSRA